MKITPVLITKNAAATLSLTLESLSEFDEIVVLDTGSNDRTLEISRKFKNVKLFKTAFSGFGKAKNQAARLASNDWIFSIDADEVVTPELMESIKKATLSQNKVFKCRRLNYYKSKRIRHSGWGKETVIRLYNRKFTQFNDKLVHESIKHKDCEVIELKGGLLHYSYLSISDFGRKREFYSELYAIEYKGKKKSSPFIAFSKSLFDFFNTFFVRLGWLDGYRGLLISVSNAYVTFMKYLKLYEANIDNKVLIKSIILSEGLPVKPEIVMKRMDEHTRIQLANVVAAASASDIEMMKSNLTNLN